MNGATFDNAAYNALTIYIKCGWVRCNTVYNW